ncbi:zinc-ribbon domain-containing protein [Marimonas sp. MJW-29]|uniref:Zinc-ribbon domain-containing protein n=1 Tax=Sulfitobacter sediminis TaxID=3234186 RepID=A0ABV3RPZ6_9RHOB
MRLTCPNCDAQYEVPDEVIPTSGRDVQCSNCGQTWFQHHPDHAPEEEEEIVLRADAPDEDEEIAPPPPPAPPPAKEPERRQLDPAVADILRQEAEAEFEARKRRQSETLESQPELGLEEGTEPPARPAEDEDVSERRAAEAKRRMARMRGEPEGKAEAAAAAAAISSRRELLPDIEEINSTLRSDTAPSGVDAEAREGLGAGGEQKQKRGFRAGFRTVVLLALVLGLVYAFAPQISQTVPAIDPLINSYVVWVDQMRLALNGQIDALMGWLNAVASETS